MRTTIARTLIMTAFAASFLFPAVADAAEEPMPPEAPDAEPGFPPPPEGRQGPQGVLPRIEDWLDDLKENDPREYERLTELRENDPEAFRKELHSQLREHFQRRMAGHANPHDETCRKLAERYHATQDPAEKEKIKEEIAAAVRDAFEWRLKQQEKMLAKMEQRLEELRARLAERRDYRDEICTDRVEELTTDPVKQW